MKYEKTDIVNSYLAASEFIYHAAIIGLGVGLVNMLVDMYNTFNLGADLVLLIFSLYYPLAYILFGALIGMFIYPFYKIYAQKRGGLTITLAVQEKPYNKSLNSTGAKDTPSS